MKGSNLRIKVKLTLEEIASGVEKKVKVFKQVQAEGAEYGDCQTCGDGQIRRVQNTILGQMQTASTCPQCQGSGQSVKKRPLARMNGAWSAKRPWSPSRSPPASRTACN